MKSNLSRNPGYILTKFVRGGIFSLTTLAIMLSWARISHEITAPDAYIEISDTLQVTILVDELPPEAEQLRAVCNNMRLSDFYVFSNAPPSLGLVRAT